MLNFVPARPPVAIVLLVAACGVGACAVLDDKGRQLAGGTPEPPGGTAPASVTDIGEGQFWLASRGAVPPAVTSGVLTAEGSLRSVFGKVEQPPDGATLRFGLGHSARGFVFQTDDGNEWYVGYSVELVNNRDVSPDLGSLVGRRARLTVRLQTSYHNLHTLVLADERGIILVLNKAAEASLIQAADTPGLVVTRGMAVGQATDACGDLSIESLSFAGDQPVSVSPGHAGSLRIGGQDYSAAVMISYSMRAPSPECPDVAAASRWWAVWRIKS